jgi:glycogen debranching enzyme
LTPAELTWTGGSNASVRFVVAAPNVLRVRGQGCSLRLYGIKGAYGYAVQRSPDSWEMLASVDMPRVEVRALRGALAVDAPWTDRLYAAFCSSVTMRLVPDSAGEFECLLHYYDAVPRPGVDSGDFESAVVGAEQEFAHWLSQLPELPSGLERARRLAAYVLWSSTVGPRGLYRQPVVWCSKSWMNRIWSWDHCFVAIGLAPSMHELAWQQWALFRDMQDPASGMLADWFSNVRRSWLCTKPPVHGWALRHLLQSMPVTNQQLRQFYEPLQKWTDFWRKDRNLAGDGLPCILNPNESFDNTTANTLFGPVQAPEIAAYLALQMEVLATVAQRLGYSRDTRLWRECARQTIDALVRVLWDGNARKFVARRVADGKTGEGDCIFSYVPLLLGRRLPAEVTKTITEALAEPGRFLTPYGLATEALNSPRYNGQSYVKGPVWGPPNVFITEGLDQLGANALASRIRRGFIDNCARQGMSEHFDAQTGAAQGDPGYNWTASLFLHFAHLEGLRH